MKRWSAIRGGHMYWSLDTKDAERRWEEQAAFPRTWNYSTFTTALTLVDWFYEHEWTEFYNKKHDNHTHLTFAD